MFSSCAGNIFSIGTPDQRGRQQPRTVCTVPALVWGATLFMPILNYTTKVSVDKSVAEIMKMLTVHGANAIMVENDETGTIVAMSFKIDIDGKPAGFRLPVKWREVLMIINDDRRVPNNKKTNEHAKCVAWRIIKDWLEAQLALLQTNMVKLDEIFLPYGITPSGKTLYEHAKEKGLLSSPQ